MPKVTVATGASNDWGEPVAEEPKARKAPVTEAKAPRVPAAGVAAARPEPGTGKPGPAAGGD